MADPTTDWHRPTVLPSRCCIGRPKPAVHLYWCRVHNGEFQTPRRSDNVLEIDPTALPPGGRPQLNFFGRTADSLRFEVSGAIIPVGFPPAPPAGFRFDLAVDSAIVLPEIAAPPAPPLFIGGLTGYPFFCVVHARRTGGATVNVQRGARGRGPAARALPFRLCPEMVRARLRSAAPRRHLGHLPTR